MNSGSSVESRIKQIQAARAVFIKTLGLNLLVSICKLVCGFLTNTISMVADGFHSLMDGTSNIIGIIGLTIASKPADSGHPYGHRKFEALAAIVISFIMFFACFNVISRVFDRIIFGGEEPRATAASYLIMVLTVMINIGVTIYERRMAKKLNSPLLKADSEHTLSDIYVSMGVFAAIFAAQYKLYWIDPAASIIIIVAIFYAGFGIIKNHLGTLVDAAVVDSRKVIRIVEAIPGVIGCHNVRSRGMYDEIFLDLHVQVAGHLTVEEGHRIASDVEQRLKSQLEGVTDVIVHIEDHIDHAVEV